MKRVEITLPPDLSAELATISAARRAALPPGAVYLDGTPIVEALREHLRSRRAARAAQAARMTERYHKIARDLAIRIAAPFARLIDREEAASLGAEALLEAAHRFDPSRATSVWPLAKLRISQKVQEAIDTAMKRAAGQVSSIDGEDDPLDRIEAPPHIDEQGRAALQEIAAWAAQGQGRRATLNRAVAGRPLSDDDLSRLEELRARLGLPSPDTVSVGAAAAALGRSSKAVRKALVKGQIPGVRSGSGWRVFLRAALRVAPSA